MTYSLVSVDFRHGWDHIVLHLTRCPGPGAKSLMSNAWKPEMVSAVVSAAIYMYKRSSVSRALGSDLFLRVFLELIKAMLALVRLLSAKKSQRDSEIDTER